MKVLEAAIEQNCGNKVKEIYGWVKLDCQVFKAKNSGHEAEDSA